MAVAGAAAGRALRAAQPAATGKMPGRWHDLGPGQPRV